PAAGRPRPFPRRTRAVDGHDGRPGSGGAGGHHHGAGGHGAVRGAPHRRSRATIGSPSGRPLMPGAFRRVMVYLGLVDDDYEDYEPYEDPQTVAPPARPQVRSAYGPEASDMTAGVRTLPREPDPMSGVSIQPRPAVVRPIQPTQATKVHVVVPG